MDVKQETIKQLNEFLQKKIEEKKMELIFDKVVPSVANLDFEKIKIIDISYKVISDENNIEFFSCIEHTIQYKDEIIKVSVYPYKELGIYENGTHSIYFDSEYGPSAFESSYIKTSNLGIVNLLERINYEEYIKKSEQVAKFIQTERQRQADELFNEMNDFLPGLTSVEPTALNTVRLIFSSGLKLSIKIDSLKWELKSFKEIQKTRIKE